MGRVVRTGGLSLISAGIIVLLFVAYQLWGTGFYQARHQAQLRNELNTLLLHNSKSSTDTSSSSNGRSIPRVARRIGAPRASFPIGTIRIPAIALNQVIVEGVAENDLSLGPGHYPGTPLPGEAGNVAIAGHRTTWGHPFYNLNELGPHDKIIITTVQGTFTYTPIAQHIVLPSDVKVLAATRTPELTLTTCNPRYSAAQRLVLVARLTSSSIKVNGSANPNVYRSTSRSSSQKSLNSLAPGALDLPVALAEGIGCLVIAGLILIAKRRLRRKYLGFLTYTAGSVAFLVILFLLFSTISLSLPASF